MKPFSWQECDSVEDAIASGTHTVADAMCATQSTGQVAILKAGGLDLLDLMKEGLLAPARIVNLRAIAELKCIDVDPDGSLRIGALATLEEVATHPLVRTRYRALALAAAQSASPQLRRMGTLGGNLLQRPRCWYFRSLHHHCVRKGGEDCFAFSGENQYHAIFGHDGCAIVHPSTPATALVALNARVELTGATGTKRLLAIADFFVTPDRDIGRENDLQQGEVLRAVVLPPLDSAVRSTHLRQGELASFDWPMADVAVVLRLLPRGVCASASIVLGAAAPVPHRCTEAERALEGRAVSEISAHEAAKAAVAGARPLSCNAYKVPIFEALVRRAILDVIDESTDESQNSERRD